MPLVEIPHYNQYLTEAFLTAGSGLKILWEVLDAKTEAVQHGMSINDPDVEKSYEQACQHQLKNALILTQQAYELYLKAKICEVSPFLLIPDQSSWVGRAAEGELSFSEVKSLNSSDLPNVANSVCNEKLSEQTISTFHDLRKLRNRFVHSTTSVSVNRHQLLKQLSHLFSLLGWGNIVRAFAQYEAKSHQSILFDPYLEVNVAHRFITVFRAQLGREFVDKTVLCLDVAAAYPCPSCFSEFDLNYNEITDFSETAWIEENDCLCAFCGKKSILIEANSGRNFLVDVNDRQIVIEVDQYGRFVGEVTSDEMYLIEE